MRLLTGALASSALLLAGCGGGDVSPNAGEVRLVNATDEFGTLVLYESSERLTDEIAAFTASRYEDLNKGVYDFSIRGGVAGAAIATLQATVKKTEPLTLVAYSKAGTPALAAIDEEEEEPDKGTAKLRFFNTASAESGAIDAYLIASTGKCAELGTAVAVASAVSELQSTFIDIDPALSPWRLCITAAGNRSDIRLDADLAIGDRDIVTFVLARTPGAVLLNGTIVMQEGEVTQAKNASARVRLAVGVGSGTVEAKFEKARTSISLGTNVPAGVVGAYQLVPTDATLSVKWNGDPVTAPSTAITSGGNFTLLVATDAGATAATATLFPDDNSASTNTAKPVKVRLVHGATTANPIGLTVNTDFIGGIEHGNASGYVLTEATGATASTVEISDGTIVLCTGPATLTAATVYSVFALGNLPGSSGKPPCVIRADR